MTKIAKKHEIRTIVTFGDSTTAPREGVEKVYSDLLREELSAGGIDVNVINKGVPGNTTNDAIARLQADVLNQEPDLVIIQFGINDSTYNVWKEPPATEPSVSLETFRENLISMVQQIKSSGSGVILMTPNVLRWTPVMLDLYGKPPYNPDDPWGFNLSLADYSHAVRDVAISECVILVDVQNAFISYDGSSGQAADDLLLDGMHPNDAGHRIEASLLMAACCSVNRRI